MRGVLETRLWVPEACDAREDEDLGVTAGGPGTRRVRPRSAGARGDASAGPRGQMLGAWFARR